MWLAGAWRYTCSLSPIVALLVTTVRGQGETTSATTHDATTATIQPTCESRTVNYITHTLPQQCLTASPTTMPSPESSSVSVSQTPSSNSAESSAKTSNDGANAQDEHELDGDGNDLGTGSFMSFEEWKKMMLDKAGQEPPEARRRKQQDGRGEAYPGENFDTLGEDGEISLDFDAYSDKISEITSDTKPAPREQKKEDLAEKEVSFDGGLAQLYRSKDAGKTCKERFSYSSFDAGATVLKTSPGAKNPKAILVENKDSYMLLECSMENKFFIVELSDDILVDTVVLANFEFFSSMIRQFRVSVSDRYPVKMEKWKVVGNFQARNSRDIQPFLVEHPQIWARYLRVEILSHYGNEYYCPISLLKVHGTRMLDSLKEADPSDYGDEESKTSPEQTEEVAEAVVVEVEEVEIPDSPPLENYTVPMEQSNIIPYLDDLYFMHKYSPEPTCDAAESPTHVAQTYIEDHQDNNTPAKPQPAGTAEQGTRNTAASIAPQSSSENSTTEFTQSATSSSSTGVSSSSTTSNTTEAATAAASSSASEPPKTPASSTVTTTTTRVSVKSSNVYIHKNKTKASTSIKPPSSKSPVSKPVSGGTQTVSRNKTTTTTSTASASPTVQDSFFKQLTKRLQTLESNTTLSLQYIELQSKFLQEALSKLERRQVSKVDIFLDTLNKTVLSELREVRTQYDQIWQSTVIALETQREQSEREIVALSTRLGVLADEVVFQKRMAIVQSVLLLGCLVLVIFSRGLAGSGMEALYYPTQFLGSSSRLASPVYPTTPRALGTVQRGPSSLRESIEDPGPTNGQSISSMDGTGISSSPLRSVERSPTPEPESRRSPHLHPRDGGFSRRPSPNVRSVSEVVGVDFYQPPIPASLDAGYDSEPSMVPNRDYISPQNPLPENKNHSGCTGPTYMDVLAKKAERQSTPSSEADGFEYSHRASKPPMSHIGSARKPLPALPEAPD